MLFFVMSFIKFFFFSSRRRHTRSVSAFLLNRSSDLSAVSDKLLDLVGLGGKSAADKGKDTRDYLAAAFPELNAWERAGADASSAGMVDAGFENQKELTKMQLDNQKEIAEMHFSKLFLILKSGDRKSGSAGMPRPISYVVLCLKKKKN